jgi:hypothetical protein
MREAAVAGAEVYGDPAREAGEKGRELLIRTLEAFAPDDVHGGILAQSALRCTTAPAWNPGAEYLAPARAPAAPGSGQPSASARKTG